MLHQIAPLLDMTIAPEMKHGQQRWRVTWRVGNSTRRKFLKTKAAAETFAALTREELRKYGRDWSRLTDGDRAELLQVWERSKFKGYRISEACSFFETHGPTSDSAIKLGELCNQCIAAKRLKGLRPESLRQLELTFDLFREGRELEPASAVTQQTIMDFIAANPQWGPWRRRGILTDLSTLFGWAVQREFLRRNPARAVERPMIEHKTPAVFTPQQCRELLTLCRRKHKDLVAWLCLCLFAGLRPGEVERLTWADIDLENSLIRLSSAQTKTRARRLVRIHDTLSMWLTRAKRNGNNIVPKYHRSKIKNLHREFGNWPSNVLRHSYVSYELARSRDIQGTALEAGHSVDILFRHYREVVTPQDAKAFWALTP